MTRTQSRQVSRIPMVKVKIATPGSSMLVNSSPSSAINSDSNFSSGLMVVVVVVTGFRLVLDFCVVEDGVGVLVTGAFLVTGP